MILTNLPTNKSKNAIVDFMMSFLALTADLVTQIFDKERKGRCLSFDYDSEFLGNQKCNSKLSFLFQRNAK